MIDYMANENTVKPLSANSAKAIQFVLDRQKAKGLVPQWNSDAHKAGIAMLARYAIEDWEKALDECKTDAEREKLLPWHIDLMSRLGSEQWDYASNLKKRLESLGLIASVEQAKGSIYS